MLRWHGDLRKYAELQRLRFQYNLVCKFKLSAHVTYL